jgi:hypothetical protein
MANVAKISEFLFKSSHIGTASKGTAFDYPPNRRFKFGEMRSMVSVQIEEWNIHGVCGG